MELSNFEMIIKTEDEAEEEKVLEAIHHSFVGNKEYIESEITLCTLKENLEANKQWYEERNMTPPNGYGVLITCSDKAAISLVLSVFKC